MKMFILLVLCIIPLLACSAIKYTPTPQNDSAPAYLSFAESLVGLHEKRDTKVLRAILDRYGDFNIDPVATPWCAAFVGAVLGYGGIKGTNSLLARSYLKWGKSVKHSPRKGDIVVFKRGNSTWQGHVGFYMGENKTHIMVLGGNQDNMVKIKWYSKHRLLDIRRTTL